MATDNGTVHELPQEHLSGRRFTPQRRGAAHATPPDHLSGRRFTPRRSGRLHEALGAPVTTYFYRTSGGASGSTTSAASIPVGATVERIATT